MDKYVENFSQVSFRQWRQWFWGLVVEVGDRGKGMETHEVVSYCFQLLGESDEHYEGPLTVPNVVDLFASGSWDVAEGCREVPHGHLMEGELPEFEDWRAHLFVTVPISPVVA